MVFFDVENLKVVFIDFDYNRRTGFGLELGKGYLHDLSYIYQKITEENMAQNSFVFNKENDNEKIGLSLEMSNQ